MIGGTNAVVQSSTSVGSMLTYGGTNKVTFLSASKADGTKMTTMINMFNGCTALTSIDLSGFDTSAVTSMGFMFYRCSALTSIDLSGFDTSAVTDMGYMFYDCSFMAKIWLPATFTKLLASSNNSTAPFYNCSSTLQIYTPFSSKPAGWGKYYNHYSSSGTLTVHWSATHAQFLAA